jgi:hypothetical protein
MQKNLISELKLVHLKKKNTKKEENLNKIKTSTIIKNTVCILNVGTKIVIEYDVGKKYYFLKKKKKYFIKIYIFA